MKSPSQFFNKVTRIKHIRVRKKKRKKVTVGETRPHNILKAFLSKNFSCLCNGILFNKGGWRDHKRDDFFPLWSADDRITRSSPKHRGRKSFGGVEACYRLPQYVCRSILRARRDSSLSEVIVATIKCFTNFMM
ncbi:hypothetical protein AVEN_246319-1 [Araneus ventricosus]|uniref:Uncharacterized protein n=1 Tax=Araneus ventricosus TaxID=182803 RepID=A0A4Y2VNN2_ARAVE|nr:hypothetical protein AVEN_237722-1 [Araneus ventricosus]GBO25816.1 hypothetical protein AVEN_47921-1 [Araneus ventricosus]GBO32604.1 hypothetical protein AVEN_245533-1 [Araneus ventricosus]GBO33077.1 hypothetical protein AVEN_232487-1 [Araneus ventricosus]GBO33078.1 hypothetical protein AVEN_246319-1 [Araneus ventricosus]